MKKLFAFLFVAVLLTGCGTEEKKTEETMDEVTEEYVDEVIEEARESSRIRSVESYMNGVEVAAISYVTLNPEIKNIKICVGKGPATTDCIIDATEAGIKSGESAAEKIVYHSGDPVICESAQYDTETNLTTITNCTVGDDTKNVYSGNTTDGIKKVK